MSLEIIMILVMGILLVPCMTYAAMAFIALRERNSEIEALQAYVNDLEDRWRNSAQETIHYKRELEEVKKSNCNVGISRNDYRTSQGDA